VKFGQLRKIEKEKELELEITRILRDNFSFRFIKLDVQKERMGKKGLESALIGTVARCTMCKPSSLWLGKTILLKDRLEKVGYGWCSILKHAELARRIKE